MKQILLLILTCCMCVATHAQEVPYSKYLNFNKKEFKDNHFKYDNETNAWALRKTNGLVSALNILAIITYAEEDVRPSSKDYTILVQMGREDKASYVKVMFYSDETYHKVLAFLKDNAKNLIETSSGKLIKHQASHGDYALELNMEKHIVTRTSSHTSYRIIDGKSLKNVDESYNEYQFIIQTDVEPWSEYLDKQAAKQAKRDAKGKKKKTVDELM